MRPFFFSPYISLVGLAGCQQNFMLYSTTATNSGVWYLF